MIDKKPPADTEEFIAYALCRVRKRKNTKCDLEEYDVAIVRDWRKQLGFARELMWELEDMGFEIVPPPEGIYAEYD